MSTLTTTLTTELVKARESSYSSHLKLSQGSSIGEYTAGKPLGSGRFATVWSAEGSKSQVHGGKGVGSVGSGIRVGTPVGTSAGIVNDKSMDSVSASVGMEGMEGTVAIKVYRAGRTNQEYWRNEVKILNMLAERASLTGITSPNIITYYGAFAVVRIDDLLEPNIHPCIVFGLAGDSVSRLLKHCCREYSAGIPLECARKVIRDSFRGLEFVHAAGLIHTDIKPSNLLLDRAIGAINGLDFNVLIGDFGSSTPAEELFSRHVGTDLYLAPELLLERGYTSSVDIWAMFTTAFELVTGDPLFDVFREFEISYGDDVDGEALEGLEHDSSSSCGDSHGDAANSLSARVGHDMGSVSMSDACGVECVGSGDGGDLCVGSGECGDCSKMDCNSEEGSSSGSEDPEQLALIAYRHLLLMEKVLGPPGRAFAKSARAYYNARGKLKNNPTINHISISELLSKNYEMSHADCTALEEFLITGLKYNPDERISAAEVLALPWLQ